MGQIFDVTYMLGAFSGILKALPVTLAITFVAFGLGLVIGFFAALVKMARVPVVAGLVSFYVSIIRGTPLLVQIYISYYGLPIIFEMMNTQWGLSIDIRGIPAIFFVYVAYALNTGAYLSETIRGAIEAVDVGQTEAAKSIGMTGAQTMRRIILPQAFLIALPNLGNTVISLIKDTSLAFSVTVVELIGQSKLIGARSLRYFEVYINAAIIYWVVCILMEIAVKSAERHFRRKRGLS